MSPNNQKGDNTHEDVDYITSLNGMSYKVTQKAKINLFGIVCENWKFLEYCKWNLQIKVKEIWGSLIKVLLRC